MQYFISDQHWRYEALANVKAFILWLEARSASDRLYLLGDAFDLWLGDDCHQPWCEPLLQALRQATNRGVGIYALTGNHDFLLGEDFANQTGVILMKGHAMIEVGGVPTLLLHGDQLCTQDVAYQRWRAVYTQRWLQRLFLRLPCRWRRWLADRVTQRSASAVKRKSMSSMDVDANTLHQWQKRHRAGRIVHGHTHQSAFNVYDDFEQLVLPDWHKGAWVLSFTDRWVLQSLHQSSQCPKVAASARHKR